MTTNSEEKSPVSIPNIGYENMAVDWGLILSLLGGTRAMRDAGQKWLPMEPAESTTSYDIRLGRAVLYNALRDTLHKLKNRPFTHAINVTDLPAEISYLENDVDGAGTSLDTFLTDVLENLIQYGIAHIFVDHSVIESIAEGNEITKAEENELGVRVFLVNVSPANLIGWQSVKTQKTTELTQIRIQEAVIEADGEYGDAESQYITVYHPDGWELHQQDAENEDKYDLLEIGDTSLGKIPLVTIYANRTGFLTADPPLMDLAWQNLSHWQSGSDQKNILRFSRFGLIFGKGLPEALAKTGQLDLGPTKALLVEDKDADLKYVEHSGKAIEAGRKDLEDIEQKMRVLGNQPLMKELPNTATAERLDEGRTVSQLQSWIRSLERGIKKALELACEWRKIESPETMAVDIYSDFEAVVLGGSDKELLLKMKQDGDITRVRLLKEEQRRGVFSQDMDPEEESEAAQKESDDDIKSLLPEDDLSSDDDDLGNDDDDLNSE